MKKRIVLLGLCFASIVIKAQTVTPVVYSNQGGYNTAAGGSISWTIGEPISETYTTSTKMTTMGFHQPELGVATLIKQQGSDAELLVFPNPVKEALTISFKDLDNGKYQMQLVDDLGKIIFSNDVDVNEANKTVELNVSQYAAGNYFLRISNPNLNKTIKINKTY